MWPWEHLAFGYLLYSGYTWTRYGGPPAHYPAIVVAVATQFPDLVDKPLAWRYGILSSARSLGHSVFFAAVLLVIVTAVARRWGARGIAAAATIGYVSHVLGDIIYPMLRGESPNLAFLFWPFTTQSVRDSGGVLAETSRLLTEFVLYLGSPSGRAYLAFEVGLLIVVFLVWLRDGHPGLRLHR